jgi:preprotein translocase subunit YajC
VKPENLLLLVLLGGLLFMVFSRQRKQQREAQQTQASISVGAEVMMTAGLYGTVVGLDEQTVLLETAPGQRSRWDRRAVARILDEASPLPPLEEGSMGDDLDEGAGEHPGSGDDGDGTAAEPGAPTAPPDRS